MTDSATPTTPRCVEEAITLRDLAPWNWGRANYDIAVLGARRSGKTTLIRYWRNEPWLPSVGHTSMPDRKGTYTKLDIDDSRITFRSLSDISGAKEQWDSWEALVAASQYVVYLVDARVLCGCLRWDPTRNLDRLEDDIGQIRGWLGGDSSGADMGSLAAGASGGNNSRRRCVLAVTHTDQDCRLRAMVSAGTPVSVERYRSEINRQLKDLVLRVGGYGMTRVVIGSLRDETAANALSVEIVRHLANWEKAMG